MTEQANEFKRLQAVVLKQMEIMEDLATQNKELVYLCEGYAAALVMKDEALRYARGKLNHNNLALDCVPINEAIALQPHAELVRKIKADAVREAIRILPMVISDPCTLLSEYADRIENEGA